jgi:hypothetical protein
MQKNTFFKNIAFLSIFHFGFISSIQSQVQVTGDVLNPTTYTKQELESIARKKLVIPIKNHLGKKKMTFKANQAIKLTDFLSKITLLDSLPKK